MLSRACSVIQPVSTAGLRGAQDPGPMPTPPRVFNERLQCPQLHAGAMGETGKNKERPCLQGIGSLFKEEKFIQKVVHDFQLDRASTSIHDLISFSQPFNVHVIILTSQTGKQGSEKLRDLSKVTWAMMVELSPVLHSSAPKPHYLWSSWIGGRGCCPFCPS